MSETYRCFTRQLPCLYALPQSSHFRSPAAAFSFLLNLVPSLARRMRFFVLSMPWNEDSAGPSTTALSLPVRAGIVTCWGRLLGMGGCPPSFRAPSAALDTELLLLTDNEPSATACSTAAPKVAAFVAGEKVELFLRLMRFCVPTDPLSTAWEWDRLYEFRTGMLMEAELTEGRRWLVGRDISFEKRQH